MKTMGVRRVSTADKIDEEIRRNGFSIIRGVFKPGFVEAVKMAGLQIFFRQQESFKKRSQELKLHPVDASNPLNSIGDVGICRAPFVDSPLFRDQMLLNLAYLSRIKTHLDDEFVLYSQVMAISNPPPAEGITQTGWHREIFYQHFTCSRVIAFQVLVILDDFNQKTGGTAFLPGSHLWEEFPCQDYVSANEVQPELEPGDVVLMNSFVYHRAGQNLCLPNRSLVTNTFVRPFIASQFDYVRMTQELHLTAEMKQILGYKWRNDKTMTEWRLDRLSRL